MPDTAQQERQRELLLAATPWVFVLIWSTGFVVARYAMPHAPPLTFLSWRYLFSLLAFALWIAWVPGRWPIGAAQWGHLAVSGALMHAGYLGGVWAAIRAGIPAGTVALIVGLQPVLTALWVSSRGAHHVAPLQWLGLLLGLGGLLLVVWPKLGGGEVTPFNLGLSVLALLSITVGTLYQKQHVRPSDVRCANFVQIAAAFAITLPAAAFESGALEWHVELIGALIWSVLGLTLGGSSLLMLLIQRGAATRVASLLYLVPPCTAVLAWWLFGEAMGVGGWCGMALLRGGRRPGVAHRCHSARTRGLNPPGIRLSLCLPRLTLPECAAVIGPLPSARDVVPSSGLRRLTQSESIATSCEGASP